MSDPPSAAKVAFGKIAPALADYTDQVLFGDVWKRPGLFPARPKPHHRGGARRPLPDQRAAGPPQESARERRHSRRTDRIDHASRVLLRLADGVLGDEHRQGRLR